MYETSGQKDKNSSEYRLGEKMQNHEVQTPRSARSTHGGGPGVTTPRRGKVLLDETDRNQFQHHHSKSPSRLQAYQMADERVLSAKRHLREAPSPRKPKESQQKEHSRYDQEASGMREQAVYENYSRDLANLLIERELLRERSKDQKMAYDQHSRSRSAKVDFLDKHKADLERQKELKAHLVSVHDQYRQTNLKMAKERVQEKLQQTKADGEIMKKLVEYEQLKAEAAKAIKDKEAQRVQTYRNEVKAQALEDRKRHSDLQAKDRSVSPGFLGTIE